MRNTTNIITDMLKVHLIFKQGYLRKMMFFVRYFRERTPILLTKQTDRFVRQHSRFILNRAISKPASPFRCELLS